MLMSLMGSLASCWSDRTDPVVGANFWRRNLVKFKTSCCWVEDSCLRLSQPVRRLKKAKGIKALKGKDDRTEREISISTALSIDISPYTIDHAGSIVINQIREQKLKADLASSLLDPCFDKYRPTFELFGFGSIMQSTVLSTIYLIEKFLVDGKPHIDRDEDDRGEKCDDSWISDHSSTLRSSIKSKRILIDT
jgi:hypothetical protein